MTLGTHHKYIHKTEMVATNLQRFTERQLVKQDRETGGWEKTLVLFTGDTMRSNR